MKIGNFDKKNNYIYKRQKVNLHIPLGASFEFRIEI